MSPPARTVPEPSMYPDHIPQEVHRMPTRRGRCFIHYRTAQA